MEKNLSRKIDFSLYNKDLLDPIINEVGKNNNKYFLACRTAPERITIYYKGGETLNLQPKNKDKWFIEPREMSKGKKYEEINKEYEEALRAKGFLLKKMEMLKDKNYLEMLEITTNFLDKYYQNRDSEKTIQGDIASKYRTWNKDLICVDMEYTSSFLNKSVKDSSGIQGRYDLVMLRKENDKLYVPVFVELKSRIDTCTYPNAGIINHISDIEYFLKSYKNNDNQLKTNLQESIKNTLKFKRKLGLIKEDIFDKIDFDKPEFRLLFVMVNKEKNKTPLTRYDTDKLVDKEIAKAKSLLLHKDAKSNKKVYETMLKKPVDIDIKLPKWELEKYPDIVNKIKDKVYNYAYYDEFNKVK